MWRTILLYRYLLLACFVLAAAIAVEYRIARPTQPRPVASPPVARRSLRDRYLSLNPEMTARRIQGVLGPPDQQIKVALTNNDTIVWIWREGQDCVLISVLPTRWDDVTHAPLLDDMLVMRSEIRKAQD